MVMEAMKCLSVKNPWGYLICAGVKDVENRTWETDYRGRLYIHSSGELAWHCYFPEYKKTLPIQYEFSRMKEGPDGPIVPGKYVGYDAEADEFFLKPEGEPYRREYELYARYMDSLRRDIPYFKAQAIIGHVELVDIVKGFKSPWADKNAYHWIIKNPVLLDNPIMPVKGRLRIFDFAA